MRCCGRILKNGKEGAAGFSLNATSKQQSLGEGRVNTEELFLSSLTLLSSVTAKKDTRTPVPRFQGSDGSAEQASSCVLLQGDG